MRYNSRWIFQALILSALLNIVLLGIFFYFLIRDNPLHFSYCPKEFVHLQRPPIPSGFLERLPSVAFDHLLELLADERTLESGFQVCEVALGALALFHHFDVERGLGKGKLSKHIWEFEGTRFLMFPGLSKTDFETLRHFAYHDQWPLTAQGLFERIRGLGLENCEQELIHFFCHTPEFVLFETLFARTHLPIQKRKVLNLALEGGWEKFAAFSEAQKRSADFSSQMRQQVLLGAIDEGSKTAAYLLLLTDTSFATHQLDDVHLTRLLDLMSIPTPESLQFVQTIAASARIEGVRQKALTKISDYTGVTSGEMAGHFYEKPGQKDLRPVFRQTPPAAPSPLAHVVQEGESLWIIARKYKVSLDALMEANQLHNSVIRPGKALKIPLQALQE